MPEIRISRRALLMAATATTGLRAAPMAAKPMRLGGPIFVKSDDPAVEAKAHRDLGYRAAYVPSDLTTKDTDRIAATVENCRKVIDAVNPKRARFTIEMMPWALPSTPDEYLTLIKTVDRKPFGVHLDVCNTMSSPERLYNNAAVIDECFRKLGQWIVSCHAKDLQWGPGYQVNIQEVIPGTGVIDYKAYLRNLSQLRTDAPLMLEHLRNEAEYTQGREYIQGVARSLGLSFERA